MTNVCCMSYDLRLYKTKMTWNNVFDETQMQLNLQRKLLIREFVKVNCTGNQSVYSCEVWWAADFQAVKMIIRAQFIKDGKVDLAWSLFIVPETMPITEIFEGIKSGMYFYVYHFTNWSSMPSDK